MRSCSNTTPAVKRGTTPTLQVYFDGVEMSDVGSITFLLKADTSEITPALVEKVVENPESNPVDVEFTVEDTYLLPATEIWMDTRIVLHSGKIPPTEMVQINVMATLFPENKGV